MISNVQLTLTPRVGDCRAVIDGVDISNTVSGVDVKHRLGDMPTVEIHMPIHTTMIDGQAHVVITKETKDILTGFGWTPPGELARLAKTLRDLLDVVDDLAVRNTDLDAAAGNLRGELVDLGWIEAEERDREPA